MWFRMNKGAPAKRGRPSDDRVRMSIVVRLNAGFFFELLGIFLLLDIVLLVSLAAASAGRAERAIRLTADAVGTKGLSGLEGDPLLKIGGVTAAPGGAAAAGREIPSAAGWPFFDKSLPGPRYLFVPDGDASVFQRLDGLAYRAQVKAGGVACLISVSLGEDARRARIVFCAAGIAELFLLFFGLRARAQRVRRILRPISELAETARTLNRTGSFTPEEMKALAGKINGINASRLDTRIAVNGTQQELRNLADAINGMLDRIDESYRAQVRFVSDASHELRTPIAVIQGYVSLLDRWGKNDPKALQESISAIKGETDNMKLLVEQLLFLARGDSDTMVLQTERFDVSALAEQVAREAEMIDGGHEYRSELSPVLIEADEALIKQALRILVDNAVKYTPAGGGISIRTGEREGQAYLTVQDDGIGIPPEAVPRVFDRFFRTDESRARATGGAGLGLSIAKWIAERHGGHMEVLSREKLGTRISVVLPAAKAETGPETQAQ